MATEQHFPKKIYRLWRIALKKNNNTGLCGTSDQCHFTLHSEEHKLGLLADPLIHFLPWRTIIYSTLNKLQF